MPPGSDDLTPDDLTGPRRRRRPSNAPDRDALGLTGAADKGETGAAERSFAPVEPGPTAEGARKRPYLWAENRTSDRLDPNAPGDRSSIGTLFGRVPPPSRRSMVSTAIWIVVAVAALLLLAWGAKLMIPVKNGPGGSGRGPGGRGQVTVSTAQVQSGDMPIQFEALGTVTPLATVTVHSRIAGVLEKVDFREGQPIRAGQRLALVDPRPYAIALKQAQGQLAHDQALLANAKLDLQRYTTLLSQDSIAKQQVDTQAALVKQDEGVVTADEAQVANARLNLDYCTVTSPVTGRVGLRHVDPGNFVQTSDANGIVTVTQISPIDVVFTLPEDNVPTVNRRLSQGAQVPVTVYDRADVVQLAVGALTALDNQIDTSTGTLKVKARFANADGALLANQFVNARVLVDTLHNVALVPTAAIRHGAPGDYVFTLTSDRTAHVRPVKLGPTNGETTAILDGLSPGETVITAGGDRLRDGAKVMLPGDRPQMGGGGRGGWGHRRGQGGGQGWQGGQGSQSGQSGGSAQGGQAAQSGQAFQGGQSDMSGQGGHHHHQGGPGGPGWQGGQDGQGGQSWQGGQSRGPGQGGWQGGHHHRQGGQGGQPGQGGPGGQGDQGGGG
jgi:multidrug efflux system membrane fusion protein